MTDPEHNRSGFCALIGRPNVGKSTLLNNFLGQKLAITSRKPQTTRHSILGLKTTGNAQIAFVDTPGIHQREDHAMNRYLNRTARSILPDVDVVVLIVEAMKWTDEDKEVLKSLNRINQPVILAINKIDLIKTKEELLPYIRQLTELYNFIDVVPISAEKDLYIDELEKTVVQHLPLGENVYPDDQLTDRPSRFFAAELVREQIIRRFAKEIPYSVTVEIEKFEQEKALLRISALVWVERDGQKRILIGQGGKALKEVGRYARLEMEKMFESKVYLNLWVKVKKSWSSDETALNKLGYFD